MRSIGIFSTIAIASALSVSAVAAPERAGDFALLDQHGEFHQFSKFANKDAVVVLSQANSCAASQTAAKQLQGLRAEWEAKNVAFLMINSAQDDLTAIRSTAEDQGIDLPILLDSSQLVAETLNITKAGEILILDPQRLSVLYRGPLGDHVAATLTSAQAGTVEETMDMEVSGCDLNIAPKPTLASVAPDYATEVAPIIVENCAECHREGGIGPFAMNSHLMLQGWSPMIREVLMTKRMPPMRLVMTLQLVISTTRTIFPMKNCRLWCAGSMLALLKVRSPLTP